jgi:glutamate-1-semialdehyde 2,1-aminomutase
MTAAVAAPETVDSAGEASRRLYQRARRVLPGGVSSPVRAFGAVGGTPLFLERGEGAHVVDADGRRFLDFVGSWGPLVLGHAHPEIVEAVARAARAGTTFGAPCAAEVELAERIVVAYPGLEQVRFVSSGTEATMSAVRLARGATGRDLVVKFAGCYHGHADHLLVAAGSGLATFGTPSSAGVPAAFAALTRVLPLDDEAALADLFAREGDRIAAAIVEPVPANHGLLLQRREFLLALRALTLKHGALLVFDEVISGFRVAEGGAAERFGIVPDLATFGKIVGGGLPVGAFGGPRELMRHLAPEGAVYQAGTLSGNPVAMAAGAAALDLLARERAWERLEALGARLDEQLAPLLAAAPEPASLVRIGSLFWLALQPGAPPRRADALDPGAAARYARLFHALLARGVALAPSAYEVGFLSLAHREADVDRLARALGEALAEGAGGAAPPR